MPELKRCLKLQDLVIFGVGIILGAGIYALVGKAAGITGNSIWLSFGIGALIASFTALSFAELSSKMPQAAGEYVYITKAFKSKAFSFVLMWLLIIVGISTAAAVSLGFSGYLNALLGTTGIVLFESPWLTISTASVIAILLIGAAAWFNYKSVKSSSTINTIFTFIEVTGLLLIIFAGILFLTQGNALPNLLEMPNGISGVMGAMAVIFFAYLGFDEIINMAEDVENPRQNLPKALILSVAITSIFYILVSIAAVTVVPWQELGLSEAPLADVASGVFGSIGGILLGIIALFATANTVLIVILAVSREIYGTAREEKAIPRFLSKISEKTHTPANAILFTFIIAVAFALMEDIVVIAELADFGLFTVFLFINLAVIFLRYSNEKHEGQFKVPLNIGKFPVLSAIGALSCLVAILSYIIKFTDTGIEFVLGESVIVSAIIFAIGIVLYLFLSKREVINNTNT